MKHLYYVTASVNTEGRTDAIVSTTVALDHLQHASPGMIVQQLFKTIPNCQAIINYWEYDHEYQTTQYQDAKIYVMLMVGELHMIAQDTKDPKTQKRLRELLENLNIPKIVRRFEGRVRVDEGKES